jgi:hypothetical protein
MRRLVCITSYPGRNCQLRTARLPAAKVAGKTVTWPEQARIRVIRSLQCYCRILRGSTVAGPRYKIAVMHIGMGICRRTQAHEELDRIP